MRNRLRPGSVLGYCTNVHAGASLEATVENLRVHSAAVRTLVAPNEPMGIGLWLSASAAREARGRIEWLGDEIAALGLEVFTMNVFPYGDFHQEVVKTAVYEPSWLTDERVAYTIDAATVLAGLGEEGEGSLSTLPIGWGLRLDDSAVSERAWTNLMRVVAALEAIESTTGRCLHLDIEPEPGCVLGSHADAADWMKRMLPEGREGDRVRRYLRICHDICHAAVMFEDQAAIVQGYREIGVRIGKVQVSNAIRAVESEASVAQLGSLCEDRYQHQTVCRDPSGEVHFEADLPDMLLRRGRGQMTPRGEWRVHFHVPIGLGSFGDLETTREMIPECVELLREEVDHWEVETYAWSVLPRELQSTSLGEGIADELKWFLSEFT